MVNTSVKDDSVKGFCSLITCVAIAALIGFSLFIIYMLRLTSAAEVEWTRAVYLLTGVEAVGFAAAGYLFGKDVNRARAEKAEEQVDKLQVLATDFQTRAVEAETKGSDLANSVRATAEIFKKRGEVKPFEVKSKEEAFGLETLILTESLDKLSDFATKLFPK